MVNAIADSVSAFAPATVANVGVGFDILGLALRTPGDVVRVVPRDEPGVELAEIEGDSGLLSRDPVQNTACIAAASVLRQISASQGVRLSLVKGLPLASGLGSSAASAVAAALAVNTLFGQPLERPDLLPACLDGEAAVSGRHADNVAPGLLGGIVLVTGLEAETIFRLPVPAHLWLALVSPGVAVPTAEARAVLPQQVPVKTMIHQTAMVAQVVNALYREDLMALAHAMEADQVVEPARAHLMPRLHEARAAAKRVGALGLVISGAGPSLCAVCDGEANAQQVSAALQALYDEAQIPAQSFATQVSADGARVLGAVRH